MKSKTAILLTSLCAISILTAGCTMCPTHKYDHHEHQYKRQHKDGPHKPQSQDEFVQASETVVFYQTYDASDINNVSANMYTNNAKGGESAMGTIKFKETDNGLKMKVDLEHLRPGKVYNAQVYQCQTCNENSICCDTEAMAIELPKLKIDRVGRLQQSYIVRGLTAAQLNNAKIILTRDGGHKAAWGTLNQ